MKIKKKLNFWVNRYFLSGVDVKVIVSTGRTGTQFFEHLYRLIDPDAVVHHEPRPDLFDLSLTKVRENGSQKELQDYIIQKRGTLLRSRKKIMQRFFGKRFTYIESNPFLYPLLSEYEGVFRSLQMIYITRDPKTYLVSAFNKDPQSDGNNNFYGASDKRKRLTAVDFGEMKEQEWEALSRIERIAWYWNTCNTMIYSAYQQRSKAAVHVNFEDIFSNSESGQLEALTKILKLTHPHYDLETNREALLELLQKRVNKSRTLSDKERFEDFDLDTQKKIQRLIAPMVEKLGYNKNS